MSAQKIPEATVQDVKKALSKEEDIILLDVRTESEFSRGKIAGAINLPLQEIDISIENLIPTKSQKIYVYCLSGTRSTFAVQEMLDKGYTNVYNVENGLLAWRAKRYPVEI